MRTVFSILVVIVALSPGLGLRANDLTDRVKIYEGVKKEWIQSRRGGPKRRGKKKNKKGVTSLGSYLSRIAQLGSEGSLRYLAKEYGDVYPEVAVWAAEAMMSDHYEGSLAKKAISFVIRGYDRRGKWSVGAKAGVLDSLVKKGGEKGLAFVAKLAARGSVDQRTMALGSLALKPNAEESRESILKAIANRSPQLRRAGLRAAKKLKHKSAISVLIERIEKEKDEALKKSALELLVGLAGVNFGFEPEDWNKWWKFAEGEFEIGKVKQGGATKVRTPDLAYFGIEITSKRICFLIDASKSMQGGAGGGRKRGAGGKKGGAGGGRTKIAVLKEELSRILKKLPETTYVNIIPFARQPTPWKKKLHPLKGSGREEAVAFVQGLDLAGGTNIYDTLELALKDDRVDTIYLLSDGRPIGGTFTAVDDIVREISAINRVRGATIHCISFGKETGFLQELADRNGGVYRSATPKKNAPKKGKNKNGKNKKNRKRQGENKKKRDAGNDKPEEKKEEDEPDTESDDDL